MQCAAEQWCNTLAIVQEEEKWVFTKSGRSLRRASLLNTFLIAWLGGALRWRTTVSREITNVSQVGITNWESFLASGRNGDAGAEVIIKTVLLVIS